MHQCMVLARVTAGVIYASARRVNSCWPHLCTMRGAVFAVLLQMVSLTPSKLYGTKGGQDATEATLASLYTARDL